MSNPLLPYVNNINFEEESEHLIKLTTDNDLNIVAIIKSAVNDLTEIDESNFSFAVNNILIEQILARSVIDLYLSAKKLSTLTDPITIKLVLNNIVTYISTGGNNEEFGGIIYNITE